jgi:hypothetical protein
MFRASIAVLLLVLLATVATSNARLTDTDTSRKLSLSCEEWTNLNDRCCGNNLDACKCPVRTYDSGWGSSWIQSWWDSKCDNIATKVSECVV